MKDVDEAENGLTNPGASLLAGVFVQHLRHRYGLERAAELVGLTTKSLQRYGKGEATPPPKTLARLAQQAGFSLPMLERLQGLLEAHRLAESRGLAVEPTSLRRPFSAEIADAVLKAAEEIATVLSVEPASAQWEQNGPPRPVDRDRAAELWQRFLGQRRDRRYRLVRESAAFHIWSFAEKLAHESKAAASHSPAEALELARLGVDVAREIQGTPIWRARVEAYALAHLGNSLRVCNQLSDARAAFIAARRLQESVSPSDPPLLDESRLPDLEASLCREEGRFAEALALLEEALALAPLSRKAPLFLNKAATLEQMGAYQSVLDALQEAEPFILSADSSRNLWCLRFTMVVCECHLGRAGQAENLLPEIQSLADRLGNALDQLRTRWLTARVAAGLERTEEAIAVLDRVCDDFLRTAPPLPIDAALAGLDLAVYWLEQGDTAAVKKLALPLERIFTVQGIRREALGALRLFCEAARREAATLELAKKAKTELERRAE